ncbi:MAG: TylF/MycF/NovP-related O-methyltransferase [Pseudomonadota bacterium]
MSLELPELVGMPQELRKGRSAYDGSQRGWGIQFGGLREKIHADPLYRDALAAAKGRTIMSEENRMNIFLLLRFFLGRLSPGHIVEYGSYRGGSAIFMAYVASQVLPGTRVFALDTYEGMPETDTDIDLHRAGDFGDADAESLRAYVGELGLTNLDVVKGTFEETHAGVMKEAGSIRMAHIDCDIASAVSFTYDGVKPFMVGGGYVVLDDATVSSCLGATEVVEDLVIRRDGLSSEQIWPHYVFRIFND